MAKVFIANVLGVPGMTYKELKKMIRMDIRRWGAKAFFIYIFFKKNLNLSIDIG